MKKLVNVSPFLLLLVPVFMMIIFTLASKPAIQEDQVVKINAERNTHIATLPDATLK